jgi:hypothetical protein
MDDVELNDTRKTISQLDDMLDAHQEMEQEHLVQDLEVAQVDETVEIQRKMDMKLEKRDQRKHLLVGDSIHLRKDPDIIIEVFF